jgi:hypothetical protein
MKKYRYFFAQALPRACKLGLLGMGSGKPLSLLSAKFLTFLCKSAVEQSRILAEDEVVETPHLATVL